MIKPKKKFMELAIKEAEKSRRQGDYAVGAVVIKGNRVIAACSNRSKRDESPIAHAETLAVMKASKILQKRHLSDCVLYCTHSGSHRGHSFYYRQLFGCCTQIGLFGCWGEKCYD